MIRCLAIDDEPLALALLADNISKVPYLQLVASCADPFKAIEIMQSEPIDLLFTDIQMPGLTGLQFIDGLIGRPIVILITAYKQYALQSYDLDVVDYLVKPVPLDRFIKACNKAAELFCLRHPRELASVQGAAAAVADYFFVNVGYSLEKVLLKDIVYIEGLRSYINIHLQSQPRPLITRATMKSVEAWLPAPDFIRIHKSYIIATREIKKVKKNELTLANGTSLPVGEIYRSAVDELIKNQLG